MSILNTENKIRGFSIVELADLKASHQPELFEIVADKSQAKMVKSARYDGNRQPEVQFYLQGKAGTLAEGIVINAWVYITDEYFEANIPIQELTLEMIGHGGFNTEIDQLTWEDYFIVDKGVELERLESLETGYELIEKMGLFAKALDMIKAL